VAYDGELNEWALILWYNAAHLCVATFNLGTGDLYAYCLGAKNFVGRRVEVVSGT